MNTPFKKTHQVLKEYTFKLDHLDIKDHNLIILTLSEIKVYIFFLETIFSRYKKLGSEHRSLSKKMHSGFKKKSGNMTLKQDKLWKKISDTSNKIRLEIESFYIFTHILLNKLTNYPETYFLHTFRRGITCGSHHQFWSSIRNKRYFNPINLELNEHAVWLLQNVIGHRDYLITHTVQKEQRLRMLIKGLTFQKNENSFSTMSTTLYPDGEIHGQTDSVSIEKIIPKLEKYIGLFFVFLEENKDKSIHIKNINNSDILN